MSENSQLFSGSKEDPLINDISWCNKNYLVSAKLSIFKIWYIDSSKGPPAIEYDRHRWSWTTQKTYSPNTSLLRCTRTPPPHSKLNFACDIMYSQVVTHPSTNMTRCCLTSVIRRERVLSTWYGCRQDSGWVVKEQSPPPSCKKKTLTLPATSCIPRWSPIQVLTWLNVA